MRRGDVVLIGLLEEKTVHITAMSVMTWRWIVRVRECVCVREYVCADESTYYYVCGFI